MPGNHGTVEITQSDQELVYSKQKIRKIRFLVLIVGIAILIGLIATLVIVLTNSASEPESDVTTKDALTLDDIVSGRFFTKKFNGTWSGKSIIYPSENKLAELNISNFKKSTLLDLNDNKYRYTFGHEKSSDGKYLLVGKEYQKIYRHSFLAKYIIVNLDTKAVEPVTIRGNHEHLLLAKWAPKGNGLILNFEGNLYYKPGPLQTEIVLTEKKSPRILNGIPDWVYEEEVFSSNDAVWFNPSGTKIAFVQFDDSPTRIMNIPVYGEPSKLEYQYPWQKQIAYPKSGTPNPLVKLYQVDLDNLYENSPVNLIPVPVPSALNTESHIISIVQWLNDEQLLSVWMNRVQNIAYLQVFNNTRRYGLTKVESETGWVDLFAPFHQNREGSQIALILPHNQGSNFGDYRHLTLLQTRENSKPIALTNGKYVVQSIEYWDSDANIIFYMANTPDKSEISHLYGIKAVKNEKPQCLTCGFKLNGVDQNYFSVEFSGKYLALTSLGPSPASTNVYEWSLNSGNIILKKLLEWENNQKVNTVIANKSLPIRQFHTIDIADGFTAKVLLLIPPNIKPNKKYPMLVDVYGGPDSNAVVDKFAIDYGTYLAANRSIIYAKIDGRGSGLRGDKLLHSIYLKLGTVEVEDQIDVARKLSKKLPFIDPEHIGIWGWSYGGFASGMALANDNSSVFKCAASVAPVTDWLYYDSIYTERYMKTPDENELGYVRSRLSTLGTKFEDKKYLLVHGTLDDNVHYQQGMMLAKNLERNDILFKQISYPDEDHSLSNVRPHLYNSLDRFFGSCFNLENSKFFR